MMTDKLSSCRFSFIPGVKENMDNLVAEPHYQPEVGQMLSL